MANPLSKKELDLIDAYWRAANYLSVGQIYLYDNPSVLRSVVMHEFGHLFFDQLTPPQRGRVDTLWRELERTALFYVVTDGEYSGNSRFGGHPQDSPEELYASAYNLFANREDEIEARLAFVPPEHRVIFDSLRTLVRETLPVKTRR